MGSYKKMMITKHGRKSLGEHITNKGPQKSTESRVAKRTGKKKGDGTVMKDERATGMRENGGTVWAREERKISITEKKFALEIDLSRIGFYH